MIKLQVISSSAQFITLEVSYHEDESWLFTAIYGSPCEQLGDELWDKLSEFNHYKDHPWLLARDFNNTKSLKGRHNCGESLAR